MRHENFLLLSWILVFAIFDVIQVQIPRQSLLCLCLPSETQAFCIHYFKICSYHLLYTFFIQKKLYNTYAPSSYLWSLKLFFLFLVIIAFCIQVMILGGDFLSLFGGKLFLQRSELKMDLAILLCEKYKALLPRQNGPIEITYNTTT